MEKKLKKNIKKILRKVEKIEKIFTKQLNMIQMVSITCLVILLAVFISERNKVYTDTFALEEQKFKYLSDIDYVKSETSVGWGSITLDANLDASKNDGLITLLVNKQVKKFIKGITAHATSTVVYDISEYQFDYFKTYYGIDAARGTNGNGVKFAIYTSVDGENWQLHTPVSPPIKKEIQKQNT